MEVGGGLMDTIARQVQTMISAGEWDQAVKYVRQLGLSDPAAQVVAVANIWGVSVPHFVTDLAQLEREKATLAEQIKKMTIKFGGPQFQITLDSVKNGVPAEDRKYNGDGTWTIFHPQQYLVVPVVRDHFYQLLQKLGAD